MAAGSPILQSPPHPPQSSGQPQGQGLDAPASRILQWLAGWIKVAQEIAEVHPQIASMMTKVSGAVREALGILAREANAQQGQGLPPESQPTGQATVPPQPSSY